MRYPSWQRDAKEISASLNYRVFIALLVERSGARVNLGARRMVEMKGMSAANYESVADFERELLWMLNK